MFYYKKELKNSGIYLNERTDYNLSLIVTEADYNEAEIILSRKEVQELYNQLGKFLNN